MSYRIRSHGTFLVAPTLFAALLACPVAAKTITLTRTFTPPDVFSGDSAVSFSHHRVTSPHFECSPSGDFVSLLSYYAYSDSPMGNNFDDLPFELSLRIDDLSNPGASGTVTFKGKIKGRMSMTGNNAIVSLTDLTERSVLIGDTVYTINNYIASSPPRPNDVMNPGTVAVALTCAPAGHTDLATATAPVRSSPTAVDGIAFFGDDDGRVHAVYVADGSAVPGFPSQTPLAGSVLSRAAVYGGGNAKSVYLTTDQGYVAKIGGGGQILWSVQPLGPGSTSRSTPAVTPDGKVFVGITGSDGSRLARLSDADGNTELVSALLGGPNSSISSPAVSGNRVFVGLTGGSAGDIAVLEGTSFTVLSAGVAPGESVTAPPYVKDADMYVGTLGANASGAGRFYKLNSATGAEDAAFGLPEAPGSVLLGEPIATSAFHTSENNAPQGVFYVGSTKGKVWHIDAKTGVNSMYYDTMDGTEIGGLVISDPGGVLALGTAAGAFYQVSIPHDFPPASFVGLGAIRTAPTFDRASNRFIVGTDDNHVYSFAIPTQN